MRGLMSNTGSTINIDRAELSNTGFGADTFVVQETGNYRTADGREVRKMIAGSRITQADADKFGLTKSHVVEGALIEGAAVEGERIAMNLRAAGYDLSKSTEVTVNPDPATNHGVGGEGLVSTVQEAENLKISGYGAGEPNPAAGDYPKWFQEYQARFAAEGREPAPMFDGETRAAYEERTNKGEEATEPPAPTGDESTGSPDNRSNENEPTEHK